MLLNRNLYKSMTNSHLTLFLSFILMTPTLFGQGLDFADVDAHARKLNKSATYQQTAERLVAPFESEADRARAIFIWITDNIDYDIKGFNTMQQGPRRHKITYDAARSEEEVRRERQIAKATEAFRKKKGVCQDYAYLFQYMCEHVGIEAVFIPGHGRFSPQSINRPPKSSNHAWNAVRIDSAWYLLDATWAAGNTDMEAGKFTREYKEGYFMTPPDRFITTHFPDNPEWQLLETTLDADQFSRLPYTWPALTALGITDYGPKNGVIGRKSGLVDLFLTFAGEAPRIILMDNQRESKQYPEIAGNTVRFRIDAAKFVNHELILTYVDGKKLKPIIAYKVF